jgi:hypothetical protein
MFYVVANVDGLGDWSLQYNHVIIIERSGRNRRLPGAKRLPTSMPRPAGTVTEPLGLLLSTPHLYPVLTVSC